MHGQKMLCQKYQATALTAKMRAERAKKGGVGAGAEAVAPLRLRNRAPPTRFQIPASVLLSLYIFRPCFPACHRKCN